MVIRIFDSAQDNNFGAVKYNDEKIDKGNGQLILAKNFPSYVKINDKENVKNYFKSIRPENSNFKNLQFHATISCKGKEYDKNVLKNIGDDFMKNLGYGMQPYILIFHNDTKNNHIHIVSTNVNVDSKKRMENDFRKLKSQIALKEAEKNVLGIDYDKKLERLLNYNFSNLNQLEKLLIKNNYSFYSKNDNFFILKNGVEAKVLNKNEITFNTDIDKKRASQISAILTKYSENIDNNVFKIEKEKKVFEFNSLLQKELKIKFGFDIIFSYKDEKNPFGFILIDNKTNSIFKGSDVGDMKKLFNFTDVKVDKSLFELLENSYLKNEDSKKAMKFFLEKKYNFMVPDYLLNFGKKLPYNVFKENQSIVKGFSNGSIPDVEKFKNYFSTIKNENDFYFVNEKDNVFLSCSDLLNEKQSEKFDRSFENTFNQDLDTSGKENPFENNESKSHNAQNLENNNNIANNIQQVSNALLNSSHNDSNENPNKQRKKRKKFRR